MSLQDVRIGGETPAPVLDVATHSRGGSDLSAAEIDVAATRSDLSVQHGDDAVVEWSDYIWRGTVTGFEPLESTGETRIKGIGRRLGIKHNEIHTVFYDTTSSEAVKSAVTERSKPLDRHPIHVGSDLDDWESNAPVCERYAGTRAGLYDWGTDFIFLGARRGHSRTLTATYTDVSTDAIVDGIFRLDTRVLVNDASNTWDTEIELVTPDNITYLWEPDIDSTGFTTLELNAEEASTDGQLDQTGVLQYRFKPSAAIADNTGIAIDNAHTLPFERIQRDDPLDVSGVQSTDRRITRRVDNPAGVFIDKQATEDGFAWWEDDNVLHYQPGDNDPTDLSIEPGDPVLEVNSDRDAEDITNVVTVQGARDIEYQGQDQGSIQYYGPVPRPEPIVDESIHSEDEARARAEGYLDDHAWDDAEIDIQIANTAFAALTHGDRLPVTWPPDELDDTYTVSETETSSSGVVTITIAASSGKEA